MQLSDGYTDLPTGKLANVVTCLEMLERPRLRPERAEHPWSLHRIESPEADWYRDLFRRVGEPWLWFSALALQRDELLRILRDPAIHVYSVRVDRRDEGLVQLDFRKAGECELIYFGLTPALIGTGAGRWALNRAIEEAWSQPIHRFWLHTCTLDHPGALGFYIRSGFRPYKRQIEICDDPRLTGILSKNAAPEVPLI